MLCAGVCRSAWALANGIDLAALHLQMPETFNQSVYEIFGGLKKKWPTLTTMAVLDWQTFPSDLPLDVSTAAAVALCVCVCVCVCFPPCLEYIQSIACVILRAQIWVDEYADYGTSPSYLQPTAKETLRQSWLASKPSHQFWWSLFQSTHLSLSLSSSLI